MPKNYKLMTYLEPKGFRQATTTPILILHNTRPLTSTLVVNNFGIKYVGKEHTIFLKDTLEEHYDITIDWTGSKYLGLTLKWDYLAQTCDISTPGYIDKVLQKFHHPPPPQPQHAPHP